MAHALRTDLRNVAIVAHVRRSVRILHAVEQTRHHA